MINQPPVIDLTRYIEARHFGERPHIRGRRLPIAVIMAATRDNEGVGVPELMYAYDLSETEVLAALLYYNQHQAEIDAQEAAIRDEYRQYYE